MVIISACHSGGLGSFHAIAWNFWDDCKNETKTGTIEENETKTRQLKKITTISKVIEKTKNITMAIEKLNNNEAFKNEKSKNNIFLEIAVIKINFKRCHLEYWKNNLLIKS